MKKTLVILAGNPLSLIGLVLVGIVVFSAVFADFITPFPEHVGAVVDFANFNQPPHWPNIFGTDLVGRDLFTRVVYAYRISLILGIVVLVIAVPVARPVARYRISFRTADGRIIDHIDRRNGAAVARNEP